MKDVLLSAFTIERRVLELDGEEMKDCFLQYMDELPIDELLDRAHKYLQDRIGCEAEDLGIESITADDITGHIYYMERRVYERDRGNFH